MTALGWYLVEVRSSHAANYLSTRTSKEERWFIERIPKAESSLAPHVPKEATMGTIRFVRLFGWESRVLPGERQYEGRQPGTVRMCGMHPAVKRRHRVEH